MSAIPPDDFSRGTSYGLEVAARIASEAGNVELAARIKAYETQALIDYIRPEGKRHGYELEVTVWVNHNEGDDIWPDWRTDYRQTFYNRDARSVIKAVSDHAAKTTRANAT